jgi:16S rRNA (adenine1518-N6/adenine1519-N6)-dimethyltransferase
VSTTGLLGPADVRQLAALLELRPTKRLGQNFVIDPNTVRRIVRTSGVDAGDVVVEVGPGLGSLTLGLLPEVASVVAVEVDLRLAELLPHTVAARLPEFAQRLTVVVADALEVRDLPGPMPTALVANLPYNISVPVLLTMLERFPSIQRGLVMVQAEVADRIVAAPGSRTYGVPSAKVAWYAGAVRAGAVGRRVFCPEPMGVDRRAVFAVIDAAFAQRRKTLRAALAGWAGSANLAEAICRTAGVDPGARGEALGIADFAILAAARTNFESI